MTVTDTSSKDYEPFLVQKRSREQLIDFEEGFNTGSAGKIANETKSEAWKRGWAEVQQ